MNRTFNFTIALAALCSLSGMLSWSAAAGDQPGTAETANTPKLQAALPATIRLLRLMDTDKNGKVSKQEFLHFMEAEFDFADKNHDGELDPNELQQFVQRLHHPVQGPGR